MTPITYRNQTIERLEAENKMLREFVENFLIEGRSLNRLRNNARFPAEYQHIEHLYAQKFSDLEKQAIRILMLLYTSKSE